MAREVEAAHATAIREGEADCMAHACTLQQSHGESMWDAERETIEKKGQDFQSFLRACGTALQGCPPEEHRVLVYLLQLLTGIMSVATLLAAIPQQATNIRGTILPNCEVASPQSGDEEPSMPPEELPHWRWKEKIL